MKINWKQFLVNITVSVVTIVLFFLILEGGLRLAGISPSTKRRIYCEEPANRGKFHPKYGWTEHPNSQYLVKKSKEDDWSLNTYNSKGFRDTFNSGKRNVVVLGDSYTQGVLVDDYSTYSYLLDKWTPDTAFRNYGIGATGTAQHFLLYKDVSSQVNHDLVILGYYFNDAADNTDDKDPRRPRFALNSGNLELVHKPQNKKNNLIQNPFLQRIQDFLGKHTAIYTYFAPKLKALLTGQIGQEAEEETLPEGEELNEQLNLTQVLIEKIGEKAEKNGATFLIVAIPSRGIVNPDNPNYEFPLSNTRDYWSAQLDMLRKVDGAKSHINLLNVTPKLKEARKSGERVYGKINGHCNEKGYRIIAKSIYQRLIEDGYLESDPNANLSKDYSRDIDSCP